MSALVHIAGISAREHGGELLGWSLDRPAPGGGSDEPTYALPVEGWVLGRERRVEAVDLFDGAIHVQRVPVDRARPDVTEAHAEAADVPTGFSAQLNALLLPPQFRLDASAVLEDGTLVPLAALEGSRELLRSGFEPRLQPLVVTTLGRSGSTALTRLLAAHPQIVVGEAFQYGARVASYWMSVFRELAEPNSYVRQLAGGMKRPLNERGWWLASPEDRLLPIPDDYVREQLGRQNVEALAAFAQGRIEAVYERITKERGRAGAVYFAERFQPNVLPSLMRELYPEAREILLVRDFRDVLCSMLAFDAKRGTADFGRAKAASDADYVRTQFRKSVMSLAHSWERRSQGAHLLRYEDLVLDPRATISALADYLELDSSPAAVDPMVETIVETTEITDRHKTTASLEESVERWRRDLSPELQRLSQEAYGPALEAFGYPVA
jgi:hypothetical protein